MDTLPPVPALPNRRATAVGVMPARAEQHPRITHYNWRAIALVGYTALLFLLFGIGIGASLVMEAAQDSSSNMAPVQGEPR